MESKLQSVLNDLGQPVGLPLPRWKPPAAPRRTVMDHRLARLEPLDLNRHAADLFTAYAADQTGATWTYLPYGPFATEAAFSEWAKQTCLGDDPLFFTIIDPHTNRAVGVASYLRITPAAGSIEVGHVHFSEALKRHPAATAAMFLMMDHAFSLGYRRYEWKCDALNAASQRAAKRLGFTFEGVFRHSNVYRSRNRDTAWFSIIDTEWATLRQAYLAWLAPENFDSDGRQKRSLGELRGAGK